MNIHTSIVIPLENTKYKRKHNIKKHAADGFHIVSFEEDVRYGIFLFFVVIIAVFFCFF